MSDNGKDLLQLSATLADIGLDKLTQVRKEEKKNLYSLSNQEFPTLKKGKSSILSSIRNLIFLIKIILI